ncbi:hypothetical protein ACROYT_G014511 [Oculina patagonica]
MTKVQVVMIQWQNVRMQEQRNKMQYRINKKAGFCSKTPEDERKEQVPVARYQNPITKEQHIRRVWSSHGSYFGEFGRAKIPMARPNEPDMPLKRTKKMAYTRKKTFEPADKVAVNYFKHTVRELMPPYGKTKGVMTDTEILDSTTLWTSEWLTRPSIAISELSSSIYSNLPTLKKYEEKVFTKGTISYLTDKFKPLKTALQRFNNKDQDVAEEPTKEDLNLLIKTVMDPKLMTLTKQFFAASGAMYHIAAQLMVLQTLANHPKDWASKHKWQHQAAADVWADLTDTTNIAPQNSFWEDSEENEEENTVDSNDVLAEGDESYDQMWQDIAENEDCMVDEDSQERNLFLTQQDPPPPPVRTKRTRTRSAAKSPKPKRPKPRNKTPLQRNESDDSNGEEDLSLYAKVQARTPLQKKKTAPKKKPRVIRESTPENSDDQLNENTSEDTEKVVKTPTKRPSQAQPTAPKKNPAKKGLHHPLPPGIKRLHIRYPDN